MTGPLIQTTPVTHQTSKAMGPSTHQPEINDCEANNVCTITSVKLIFCLFGPKIGRCYTGNFFFFYDNLQHPNGTDGRVWKMMKSPFSKRQYQIEGETLTCHLSPFPSRIRSKYMMCHLNKSLDNKKTNTASSNKLLC